MYSAALMKTSITLLYLILGQLGMDSFSGQAKINELKNYSATQSCENKQTNETGSLLHGVFI